MARELNTLPVDLLAVDTMTERIRATMASEQVWLDINPAVPARALLTGPSWLRFSFLLRAVTAFVLAFGLLSIPVSCALASGPHSIFVTPARGGRIIVHVHETSPAPAELANPQIDHERIGQPRLRDLPAPVTSISALVAVLSLGPGPALPSIAPEPVHIDSIPLSVDFRPAFPPPRAG